MRWARLVVVSLLLAGAPACSPDIEQIPHESLAINLIGPENSSPDNDPFIATATYTVRLSFFQDAAGTKKWDVSPNPAERTFGAVEKRISLSPGMELPHLGDGMPIHVGIEVLGRSAQGATVARGRCGRLVEVKEGQGAKKCDVFFTRVGVWAPFRPPATARQSFAAAALPDGRVLVAGGYGADGATALASVELYDPATRAWTAITPLSEARAGLTATVTARGFVVFAGGQMAGGAPSLAVDVFDPATGLRAGRPLRHRRSGHSAALLQGESVLVVGGNAAGEAPAEIVQADGADGSAVGGQNFGQRQNGCAAQVRDNLVVVCGGSGDVACFRYTGSGSLENSGLLPAARPNGPRCAVAGGTAFFVGGAANPDQSRFISLWKDEPQAPVGTWPPDNGWFAPRVTTGHAAAAANGRIVVAGGVGGGRGGNAYLRGSFIINPAATPPVTDLGENSLVEPHANHQMVSLPDGSVLVIGGRKSDGALAGAEIMAVPE